MTVNSNPGEHQSYIGVDSLYIAQVLQDDADGYLCGTPEPFAPVAALSMNPNTSQKTQYADDGPYAVVVGKGGAEIEMEITALAHEMEAQVLGDYFDATTGRVVDTGGVPPEYALGFRSEKVNGSYRYFWYYKGRFSAPSEEFQTKTDDPEPKPAKLKYTAVRTIHKFTVNSVERRLLKNKLDEDTTNASATGWFSAVQLPSSSAVSALALSESVPADAATAVSKTADLVLTFNNALVNAAITQVALIKPSDGSVVAAAIALDATKKIVTVNPSAALAGTTAYLLVYTVTDIYGQSLAGAVNFETAA